MTMALVKFCLLVMCLSEVVAAQLDLNLHLDKFANKISKKNMTLKWPVLNEIIKQVVDKLVNSNLNGLYKLSRELKLASNCSASIFDLILGLRNTKRWAMAMADASGKIPSGILEGTMMDFGSYDECLKIRVNDTSKKPKEIFRGKFCMVGYRSPLLYPMTLKTPQGQDYVDAYGKPPDWIFDEIVRAGGYLKRVAFWFGTCIPSTCTEEDVFKISSAVSKPLGFNVTVSDCQVDEKYEWPTHVIVAVCILSCIAGLCGIGTCIDGIHRWLGRSNNNSENESCLVEVPKAFSLLSNTERLLGDNGDRGCLSLFSGIRFLSATWIILGHTYFYTDTWKYLKYRHLLGVDSQFNHYLPVAVIENFTIPVGSFFFMSGFLLVYTTWRKLEKSEGKMNLVMFFIHKYWRMTPGIALTLVLFMAMPLIDSGPLWNSTLNPPLQQCRDLWWANLLYINNWWNTDQYCLIHTWYMAALMQFHIIGVILLLLAFRWPTVGVLMGFLMTVLCCIATALLTVWNNYPMPALGMVKDMDVIEDYTSRIYIKPFAHVSTYFVGMSVAYLVLKYKDRKLKPSHQALGWFIATAGALASVYGLYGPSDDVRVRAFYISCHRIGWALSIGWLTYACASGNGGIVNRILSWAAMSPLGQLSYLLYLIHPLVIIYRTASLRERVYYGHTELVFSFLSNMLVGLFLAFLGYVAVEIPFIKLEGMIFRKRLSANLKTEVTKEDMAVSAGSIKTINP